MVGSEHLKNWSGIWINHSSVDITVVFQTDKKRAVDKADGKLWADAHGFPYFEVSALTGDGIFDLFQVN